ncbi:MAG: hypothetical protein WBE41_22830 [Terracidiphilus sp.]
MLIYGASIIPGRRDPGMKDYPKTRDQVRALAGDLVTILRENIENTQTEKDWTKDKFEALTKFCLEHELDYFYARSKNGTECLWDFSAYIPWKGMLLIAESEHKTKEGEIAKDFDKLLYGNSPLKLMICRIETRFTIPQSALEEANRICKLREGDIKGSCTQYPPGSVFVVYCAWWGEEGGPSRDFAYILQVDGEPSYVPVREEQHFELVAGPAEVFSEAKANVMDLGGLGREIWNGIDAHEYVKQERSSWNN